MVAVVQTLSSKKPFLKLRTDFSMLNVVGDLRRQPGPRPDQTEDPRTSDIRHLVQSNTIGPRQHIRVKEDMNPINVLLVEDNRADARMVQEMLRAAEPERCELKIAKSLSAALESLKKSGIDVVLLDLDLPDSRGIETLVKVRESAREIPIIVTTTQEDDRLSLASLRESAQDYLIKGRFDEEVLLRSIRYAIERKRAKESQRLTESLYQVLMDAANDAIFIIDRHDRIQYVNTYAATLFGKDKRELIGQPRAKLFPTEAAARQWSSLEKVFLKGGPVYQETSTPFPSGRLWLATTLAPIKNDDGEVEAVVGISRDITAQKKAEDALKESQQFISRVIDTTPDIIYVFDLVDRRSVFGNHQIAESLGYEPGEIQAMGDTLLTRLIHPDDLQNVLNELEQISEDKTGALFSNEYRIRRVDGSWRHILDRKTVFMRNADGSARQIVGVAQDITERKKIEEALREKQRLLTEAQRIANFGSWESDVPSGRITWSDEMYRIFGVLQHTFELNSESFINLIHPLDRRAMQEWIGAALAGKHPGELDFQIVRPDGTVRFIRGGGETSFDESGRPLRIVGTALDISDRKRAEEEMAKLNKAFQSSGEVVFMTDSSGVITMVNPEFTKLYGFSPDEIIGRATPRILKSAQEDLVFYEAFWKLISSGKIFKGEMVNKTKDGRLVTTESSVNPIYDNRNSIIGFLAVQRDISERKQAERRIKNLGRVHVFLGQINQAIVRTVTRQELFDEVCRVAVEHGDYSFAWIGVVAAGSKPVTPVSHWGIEGGFFSIAATSAEDVAEGRNPTGTALRTATHVVCNNIEQDALTESWRDEALKRGYRSCATFPLKLDGKLVALLNLYSSELDHFGTEEIGLLNEITADIAYALESIARETRRKDAEEALRKSELRYRNLFEKANDAVLIFDPENEIILDANERACRTYGFTRSELVGMNLKELTKEVARGEDQIRQLLRDGFYEEFETVHFTKDGTAISFLVNSSVIEHEGKKVVLSINRDITERKRAEEALREGEERFRSLFENSTIGIYRTTPQGEIVLANPALVRMLGYSSVEELVARNLEQDGFEPTYPRDEFRLRIEKEGEIKGLESAWKRRDDSTIFVRESARTFRSPDGTIQYYEGTVEDITERKQAEEETRRRLNDLTILFNVSASLGRSSSLQALGRHVIDTVENLLGWRRGSIWLIDKAGENLQLLAHSRMGLDDRTLDRALQHVRSLVTRVGEGISGWVAMHGEPVRCGNVKDDPRYVEGDSSTRSEMCVPLKVGGRTIGSINCESDKPDAFSEHDELLLMTLSGEIAVAIENARLFEEIERELTERKKTEQALQESERRYRQVIEEAVEVIFTTDLNGNFTYANPAGLKASGYTLEELTSLNYLDLVLPIHKRLMSYAFQRQFLERKANTFAEYSFLAKSGEVKWFSQNTTLLTEEGDVKGFHVIARDVTERKAAEEASRRAGEEMRKSEERYRQLVESARDTIYTLSSAGTITSLNAAFESMTGWKVGDWIGKSFTGIVHPEDLALAIRKFQATMRGEQFHPYELRIKTPAGRYVVGEFTVTPQKQDGAVVGSLGIVRDVTERKELERQLIQAKKMESLGTLAGGIAHDFNNILGIILGHASILDGTKVNAASLSKSVEAITKATQRGASLVKQLLTFARKTEILFETVNVNDTVNEISKLLSETFPKVIDVSVHLRDRLPAILADATQLHQVLLNLCVNARDAMLPAGGTLTMATQPTSGDEVRALFPTADAMEYVHVSVADSGMGMDEATRQRIFEPFFTTKELGKGTGLGLATAYGIVQSHHGFISVESEPGRGTIFSIFFPVQPREIERIESVVMENVEPVGGSETILIVEDEEMLRNMLYAILEGKGYKVLAAQDGEEGVHLFTQHHNEIALVLSDLGLPKLDGHRMFLRLKQMSPSLKFVIASGYVEPNEKSEMFKAGVKDFVQKPYELRQILGKIRDMLDKDGAAS